MDPVDHRSLALVRPDRSVVRVLPCCLGPACAGERRRPGFAPVHEDMDYSGRNHRQASDGWMEVHALSPLSHGATWYCTEIHLVPATASIQQRQVLAASFIGLW